MTCNSLINVKPLVLRLKIEGLMFSFPFFCYRYVFIVSIQSISIMKSIQVTGDVHEHLMKLRRYPIKAVNAVVERLLEAHHSEQWKRDLRVFCLEYEYTHPRTKEMSVAVMHSLGKDCDDAQSNLSRSNFDNGKYTLIKTYPVDILYCGSAFAITPIEQIR